jgi:hypothetical protein
VAEALHELGVRETELDVEQPTTVTTLHGELRIVPVPAGTRGYDDLRRAAVREPLAQGLRPAVSSKGDLARMLSALGRDKDVEKLRQLRRPIELERELGLAIDLRPAALDGASGRMHLRLTCYGCEADGAVGVGGRGMALRRGLADRRSATSTASISPSRSPPSERELDAVGHDVRSAQ